MKGEEKAEVKKQEIARLIKNILGTYSPDPEKLSLIIVEHFCEITPPVVDAFYHLITLRPGGFGGAKSIKPGNIYLNWRKLLTDGAESILTFIGAAAVPWLIPLAGLVIWNKVWSMLNIEIDERHAVVIWTMWKNKDDENCIENDRVLNLVNQELSEYSRPEMTEKELDSILKDLVRMDCIEITEEKKWWLREWVKIIYE